MTLEQDCRRLVKKLRKEAAHNMKAGYFVIAVSGQQCARAIEHMLAKRKKGKVK